MASLRHALALAALLAAGVPSLLCAQVPEAVDPSAPELADAATTLERADAAVARLGEKRARSLSHPVRAIAPGKPRSIPALAVGMHGQARGLQAEVKDLEGAKRELGAEETELEVHIALPADVLFDVDSAAIRPDAAGALAHLATVIRGYSGAVRLVGHTDSDGSEQHNQGLSERRARSVRDWLAAEGGTEAARLSTEGRGESEPVAPNDTAANKQRNRRVDVVIAKR